MFFRSNNSRQEINLNTNLYTSFSETAQLNVGAWNKQLSIQLKPCVGKDANGLRQYAEDKSQIINTSITPENAIALITGFEKEVLPAINGKKDSGSVSIIISPDNSEARKILTIGYEVGEEDAGAYLSIALGINETGVASNIIKHKFNKKMYLTDYVSSTGSAQEVIVETDLINFMNKVYSVKDLSPIIPHAIKYNDMVKAAYQQKFSNQNYQNSTPNQTFQANVTNVNNMEDFLPFD